MKSRKMLYIIIVSMFLTFSGCNSSENTNSSQSKSETVTISSENIKDETISCDTVSNFSEETTVKASETSAETEILPMETSIATSIESAKVTPKVSETTLNTSKTTVLTKESAVNTKKTDNTEKVENTQSAFTTVTENTSKLSETTSEKGAVQENSDILTIDGIKYKLSFYDNFDGNELDKTKWDYCPDWQRVEGNYWDKSQVALDGNGNLILSVNKDNSRGIYISGAVRSKDLFEQTGGYYEIRCKFQNTTGFWSAFWLMGDTVGNVDNSGEDGTEIDIIESAYYLTSQVNHALHWDGYGSEHKSDFKLLEKDGIYEGYHTFALKWTADEYVFYIDGEETWRTSSGGVCKAPLYMKISTEAGSWAGEIKENELPDCMTVDYVKVYKEKFRPNE